MKCAIQINLPCLALPYLNKCVYHFVFIVVVFFFLGGGGVFLVFIIICNVYLTSFYVKHFELPPCMKCAV